MRTYTAADFGPIHPAGTMPTKKGWYVTTVHLLPSTFNRVHAVAGVICLVFDVFQQWDGREWRLVSGELAHDQNPQWFGLKEKAK